MQRWGAVSDMDVMDNIPDFYILGLPVRTPIGDIYPIKVKEFVEIAKYLQILNIEDFEFKRMLGIEDNEELKDIHFFEIIKGLKGTNWHEGNAIYDIYAGYRDLFQMCFKCDAFELIETSEEFEMYRDLIRSINGITYEKPNPNPEIEKYNQMKKLLESKKGDSITFKAMYTSILVSTGNNPNELTLYQFYEVFERIGHFKNFDVTTMYRMMDSDVDVNNWFGEAKKAEEKRITEERFKQASSKEGLQL